MPHPKNQQHQQKSNVVSLFYSRDFTRDYGGRLAVGELDLLIEHKRAALDAMAEGLNFDLAHPALVSANREINGLMNLRHEKDAEKY